MMICRHNLYRQKTILIELLLLHRILLDSTKYRKNLIILESHPTLSISPPLFSDQLLTVIQIHHRIKWFMGRDQNQFTVVYCDTGWILSSESNSNICPSQEISSATTTIFIWNKQQLGRFYACKLNKFLTLITIVDSFLHIILTDGMR